jgi:DNA-binding transcriptional regulator GbsR (MarR family)
MTEFYTLTVPNTAPAKLTAYLNQHLEQHVTDMVNKKMHNLMENQLTRQVKAKIKALTSAKFEKQDLLEAQHLQEAREHHTNILENATASSEASINIKINPRNNRTCTGTL